MASLNPVLEGFYETDARNYVLYGGRASSKTYHTAGFCVFLADNYDVKFLCVRQWQNRIADSVKSVIDETIYKEGLASRFNITENAIEHRFNRTTFAFLGIQRNLNEIKGIFGIDILWIEEAEALTEEQWKILEPTLREEGSRIFIVFNPRFQNDFVYQRFVVNPPKNTIVRLINYDENQYLSSTMKDVIEAARQEAEESGDWTMFNNIYLGVPLLDDDKVIIKLSWVEAAVDAHLKLEFEATGAKTIGFDVADGGQDKCANVYAHGSVVSWAEEWKASEDELLKSCSRTYMNAVDRGAMIKYDSIGVGASAGAKFDELNLIKSSNVSYGKFNAGAAVIHPERYYVKDRMEKIKNKDMFSNLKAQAWWNIADRFRNTYDAIKNGTKYPVDEMISLSSETPMLTKLKTELTTPRRDFDNNGKVKVESKKDLEKREVKSPNLADAFIIAMYHTSTPMKVSNDAVKNAR